MSMSQNANTMGMKTLLILTLNATAKPAIAKNRSMGRLCLTNLHRSHILIAKIAADGISFISLCMSEKNLGIVAKNMAAKTATRLFIASLRNAYSVSMPPIPQRMIGR